MRIESFLPSRHGFPFATLAPAGDERFGLGTPVDAAFGLGAGMIWVVLDRYLAGRPITTGGEPVADVRLQAELVQRQAAALAVRGWPALRSWQGLPERGWPWRPGVSDASRAEWRQLRRSLDAGMPVMLYLLMASGRHADPSTNQAVLAYGYEIDRRTRRISIRVYDPARPGNDGVRLVFRMGDRRHPLDARLAVQTAVRGFFCVPYDRARPASLTLTRTETGAVEGVASLLALQPGPRADGVIEMLGRSHAGGVLQIRRRRSGEYVAQKVDAKVLDSATVDRAIPVGLSRMVVRTDRGELLECARRTGLGWRGRSISGAARKSGVDAGVAIVADRAGTSLFACGSGRLMHFQRGKLARWSVENVTAGSLMRAACTGSPAAARFGRTLHAVVRTTSGELMHARWRGKTGWTAENVTARAGQRERFLIADDPVLLADTAGRQLNVVGRSTTGAVLLFRWTERAGWRAQDLSSSARANGGEAVAADCAVSAALDAEGTVHAVARTDAGGLLHAWCTRRGAAGAQELTGTRAAIGELGRIEGAPCLLAAPAGALYVVARRGSDLVLYRWADGADWSSENVSLEREGPALTHEPLARVMHRTAYVAALDHAGRLHNLVLTGADADAPLRIPGWLAATVALPVSALRFVVDSILAVLGTIAGGVELLTRGFGARAARAGELMGSSAEAMARSVGRSAGTIAAGAAGGFRVAHGAAGAGASAAAIDPGIAHMEAVSARPRAVPPDVALPVMRADEEAVCEPADEAEVPPAAEHEPWESEPVQDTWGLPPVQDTWDVPPIQDSWDAPPVQDSWDAPPAGQDEPANGPESSESSADWQGDDDALLDIGDSLFLPSQPVEGPAQQDAEPAAALPELAADEAPAELSDGELAADAPLAEAPNDAELIVVYPEPETAPQPDLSDVEVTTNEIVEEPQLAADVDWSEPAEDAAPVPLLDVLPTIEPPADVEDPVVAQDLPPTLDEAADATAEQNSVAEEVEPSPEPPADPGLPGMEPVDEADWDAPQAAAAASDTAPDDDWNLPPLEAETETGVQLDADEQGSAAEPAIAATDDDWNLPAVPAAARKKPQADDWSLPPLEEEPVAEPEPRPRKWQNPALEGLPLLDDDDEPAERAAAAPTKKPASKQPPRRKKKSTAADEMERMMALGESSRPELLSPE